MGQVSDIINGHLKELFGKEEKLSSIRLDICNRCPIVKHDEILGPICDSTKWISHNNKSSDEPKEGYIRGCGCRLNAKTRLIHNHCIVNKW